LVSFFVGINIPINYGGNKTSMINSAVEKVQLYNHKFSSEMEKLSGKTLQLVTKIDEFVERVELISNELLPQTNEAFKAAESDYVVNKIDFVNVLNAENMILKTEISLAEAKTEYYKTISELNYLVGTDITKTNFETEK
jgi:outer membrane protein TolC